MKYNFEVSPIPNDKIKDIKPYDEKTWNMLYSDAEKRVLSNKVLKNVLRKLANE